MVSSRLSLPTLPGHCACELRAGALRRGPSLLGLLRVCKQRLRKSPFRAQATPASLDLGFAWLAIGPYSHHVPMPGILLCAVLTACQVWGWDREAGVFALCWGGLLCIGEATPRDPTSCCPGTSYTRRVLCFYAYRSQKPGCAWHGTRQPESNHVTLSSSSTLSATSILLSACGSDRKLSGRGLTRCPAKARRPSTWAPSARGKPRTYFSKLRTRS